MVIFADILGVMPNHLNIGGGTKIFVSMNQPLKNYKDDLVVRVGGT